MMLSKVIAAGLISLSLTACGIPLAPKQPPPIKLRPPVELLAECPVPPRPFDKTNSALAGWLNAYDAALSACNADKATLREWNDAP
jgi:hypothetical protein